MQPTIMGWPSETLEAGPPSLGYTHWSIKSAGVHITLSFTLSLRITTVGWEGPKYNVVETKACTFNCTISSLKVGEHKCKAGCIEGCESTNVKHGVFCPQIIKLRRLNDCS